MKKLYKLYIGETIESGMPKNATLKAVVSRETLRIKILSFANNLQEGQDLYLVDDLEVSAYKRDNLDKIFA